MSTELETDMGSSSVFTVLKRNALLSQGLSFSICEMKWFHGVISMVSTSSVFLLVWPYSPKGC